MEEKVAILGCGKMGEVIATALAKVDWLEQPIRATARQPGRADHLRSIGLQVVSNADAAAGSDLLILAVKPKDMPELLDEIKPSINGGQLIISIVAGLSTSFLEKRLATPGGPGARVVRAMPNLAGKVDEGMTAVASGASAGEDDLRRACALFGEMGEVLSVDERLFDVVTALSGSGPAYFAYFVQAMTEAGIELGLEPDAARVLVLQTLTGTAKMLRGADVWLTPQITAKQLQAGVTSPGGTTEAAIKKLEENGAAEVLKSAIRAAAQRSRSLSRP